MADVFLSYRKVDRSLVEPLLSLLEEEGFSVWWDQRIDIGDNWDETIEREIAAARCVVVAWTGQSVSSRWVRREARSALDREILVPVILDGSAPPLEFSDVQAADLTPTQSVESLQRARTALIDAVERTVSGKKPTSSMAPGARKPRPWRQRSAIARSIGLAPGGRLAWFKPRHVALMATALFVAFIFSLGVLTYQAFRDLPSYDSLARYEPAAMSRLHAADGALLSEVGREKRIFIPVNSIPERLIEAFLVTYDPRFHQHFGIDIIGSIRAVALHYLSFKSIPLTGGSTITQQVARTFLLTRERGLRATIREIVMAIRLERAYSKEKILELFLNEIYLGVQSYGVAVAAQNYFSKSLNELSSEEIAFLAGIARAPNHYHPVRNAQSAVDRRNQILRLWQPAAEAAIAISKPLRFNPRPYRTHLAGAEHFDEEVRRAVGQMFGADKMEAGGLTIHTTLVGRYQQVAHSALVRGLLAIDRTGPWRGPIRSIDTLADWGLTLAAMTGVDDVPDWHLAVVLEVHPSRIVVGLKPSRDRLGNLASQRERIDVRGEGLSWGPTEATRPLRLSIGDVIYVTRLAGSGAQSTWSVVQVPRANGAVVVMDPHRGRVLAQVGGFSFQLSQFNRAAQARRPPGSIAYPFTYLAALEAGFMPTSQVSDQAAQATAPEQKVHSLRSALAAGDPLIARSFVDELGPPLVIEHLRRLGTHDDIDPSSSIYDAPTSLIRVVAAYAAVASGGSKVAPSLVDRISDRWGRMVWNHQIAQCIACNSAQFDQSREPEVTYDRKYIMSPHSAFQLQSMLAEAARSTFEKSGITLNSQIAGTSGRSLKQTDSWFVGLSADHAIGVWIGYDKPEPIDENQKISTAIFAEVTGHVLEGTLDAPFRVPPGLRLIRVSRATGRRVSPEDKDGYVEAFKPNEEPELAGAKSTPGKTFRTLCVRQCDGGFFQVSSSVPATEFQRDKEICQSKCAAPAELYVYPRGTGSLETMTTPKGEAYSKLRTAFRYRTQYVEGCSCKPAEYVPSTVTQR